MQAHTHTQNYAHAHTHTHTQCAFEFMHTNTIHQCIVTVNTAIACSTCSSSPILSTTCRIQTVSSRRVEKTQLLTHQLHHLHVCFNLTVSSCVSGHDQLLTYTFCSYFIKYTLTRSLSSFVTFRIHKYTNIHKLLKRCLLSSAGLASTVCTVFSLFRQLRESALLTRRPENIENSC